MHRRLGGEHRHPGIAYAILVVAVAIVVAILAHDIRTTQATARRNHDLILAYGYANRHTTLNQCHGTNVALLADVATAEAVIATGVAANPASSLEQQLRTAAFVTKVNAAVEATNRGQLQTCTLPALGLPKLAPLTAGARKILSSLGVDGALPTAKPAPTSQPRAPTPTPAAHVTTPSSCAPAPGESGCHRQRPKG